MKYGESIVETLKKEQEEMENFLVLSRKHFDYYVEMGDIIPVEDMKLHGVDVIGMYAESIPVIESKPLPLAQPEWAERIFKEVKESKK